MNLEPVDFSRNETSSQNSTNSSTTPGGGLDSATKIHEKSFSLYHPNKQNNLTTVGALTKEMILRRSVSGSLNNELLSDDNSDDCGDDDDDCSDVDIVGDEKHYL